MTVVSWWQEGAGVLVGGAVCAALVLTSCGTAPPVIAGTATARPVPSGSTAPSRSAPADVPPAAHSPQEAIRGYLRALDAHDPAAARAFLSPEYQSRRDLATPAFDGWAANVDRAQLRSITPGVVQTGTEGRFSAYRDVIEFGVNYQAVFRTESMLVKSGPQTEFFIVGCTRARNTWLILDIGSGP